MRPYTRAEIDAFAVYCAELDRCFFLPTGQFDGQSAVTLRLGPARNKQRLGVNWADDYAFERLALHSAVQGAIAQLGERLAGSQKGTGSSPVGSTPSPDRVRRRQAEHVGDPGQGVLQVVQPPLPQR